MRPLVSIIIPCRDAGRMLEHCLASCANQTYPSLEIVFVDNGSTDGSLEVAREFSRRSRVRSLVTECSLPGACAARNHGFDLAQGDLVQWLDADDALTPHKIERQVAALRATPEVDVAYGDWMFAVHGPAGVTVEPRPGRPVDDMLRDLLLDRWRAPNAYLLRRSLAERLHAINAFHPDTPVSQDREYFTLAAIYGRGFVFVPDSMAIHHDWSPAQVSKSRSRAARVAVLRQIFARLREHAALQPAGRITEEHQALLGQDWDFYTAPRVAFRETPGVFVAIGAAGPEKPVTATEALVLAAIVAQPEPSDLEALALVAATHPRATRAMAQTSVFADPARDIRRALDDLAERGVLERAEVR